jgi:hypothetical protein
MKKPLSHQEKIIQNCKMLHHLKPSTSLSASMIRSTLNRIKAPAKHVLHDRWSIGKSKSSQLYQFKDRIFREHRTNLLNLRKNQNSQKDKSKWQPMNLVLPNGSSSNEGMEIQPLGFSSEFNAGQIIPPLLPPLDPTPLFPSSSSSAEKKDTSRWKKPGPDARRFTRIEEVHSTGTGMEEPDAFPENPPSVKGPISSPPVHGDGRIQRKFDRKADDKDAEVKPASEHGRTAVPDLPVYKGIKTASIPTGVRSRQVQERKENRVQDSRPLLEGMEPESVHSSDAQQKAAIIGPVQEIESDVLKQLQPVKLPISPIPSISDKPALKTEREPRAVLQMALPLKKGSTPSQPGIRMIQRKEARPTESQSVLEEDIKLPSPSVNNDQTIDKKAEQRELKPDFTASQANPQKPSGIKSPEEHPVHIAVQPVPQAISVDQKHPATQPVAPMSHATIPVVPMTHAAIPVVPMTHATIPDAHVSRAAIPVEKALNENPEKPHQEPPERIIKLTAVKKSSPVIVKPVKRTLLVRKQFRQEKPSVQRMRPSGIPRLPVPTRQVIQRKSIPVSAAKPAPEKSIPVHAEMIYPAVRLPVVESGLAVSFPVVPSFRLEPVQFKNPPEPVAQPQGLDQIRSSILQNRPRIVLPSRIGSPKKFVSRKELPGRPVNPSSRSMMVENQVLIHSDTKTSKITPRQTNFPKPGGPVIKPTSPARLVTRPVSVKVHHPPVRQMKRKGPSGTPSTPEQTGIFHAMGMISGPTPANRITSQTGLPVIQMKPEGTSNPAASAFKPNGNRLDSSSAESSFWDSTRKKPASVSGGNTPPTQFNTSMPVVFRMPPSGNGDVIQRSSVQAPFPQTDPAIENVSPAAESQSAPKKKGKSIQKMAELVYPVVRRMLEIEMEHKTGRPF